MSNLLIQTDLVFGLHVASYVGVKKLKHSGAAGNTVAPKQEGA